jgi:hypothetical protein
VAASFLGGTASLSLQPRDELLDGELLGKGGARSSGAGGRGRRGRGLVRSLGGGSTGGRGSGRGRRRRGRRRRGRTGGRAGRVVTRPGSGATDSEVNAGLVGLVNGASVPPELEDTVTGGGALAAEVGRDSDIEVLVGIGHTRGGRGIVIECDERRANDGVGLGVDDRHVGNTSVRGGDVECDRDLLSGSVRLDVGGVVLEFHTLALPDVASSLVEVVLVAGSLERGLDVAVDIGVPHVEDLATAGLGERITGHARLGAGEVAMGSDLGGEGSKTNSSGVGLHSDWSI